MHGGDPEPGASVPWAGQLRAGRQSPVGEPGRNVERRPDFLPAAVGAGQHPSLAQDEGLPWLEAPDDFDDEAAAGGGFARLLLLGFVLLALLLGTVWWIVRSSGAGVPDGSLIQAESGPYKIRPQSPGGKTFAGTGDSAYAVSEGEDKSAALGGTDGEAGDPAAAAEPEAAAGAAAGVGVQVGAFMDRAAAEAGWSGLVQRNPMLSEYGHRVVAGPGDIGTIYRLQAVTPTAAAASSLCQALRDAGQECQVKP